MDRNTHEYSWGLVRHEGFSKVSIILIIIDKKQKNIYKISSVKHYIVTPLLNILESSFPTQTLFLTLCFHNDNYFDFTFFLIYLIFPTSKLQNQFYHRSLLIFVPHHSPRINNIIPPCFAHPIAHSNAAASSRLCKLHAD